MGADIRIITGGCVVGVVAITVRIGSIRAQADIVRADLTIITGISCALAGSEQTGVGIGTVVTIIAAGCVVGVVAIAGRIDSIRAQTIIIRADVIVLTGIGCTGTGSGGTGVDIGTVVTIIAAGCVVGVVAIAVRIDIIRA